jgi:hypothetical protein
MPDHARPATPWRMHPAVWAGAGGVALAAVTVLLWVRYGSTVFFEVIAAGLASCF